MNRHQKAIRMAFAAFIVSWFAGTASAQTSVARPLPRTADGKPDMNGIWQVLNTAAWDIQGHAGALGVPPGQGVVEGLLVPYRSPFKKKSENAAKNDPAETPASAQFRQTKQGFAGYRFRR